MIDFNNAKKAFKSYLSKYDVTNDRIRLKIEHTYKVVDACEFIAKDLNLSKEDVELSKLIGLLHDIGRFKQLEVYNSFEDEKTIDHADYGVEILFKDGLIREFINDNSYDEIIKKAVQNHNKYAIEKGVNERELLFSKIIRDGDKLDNFRVKEVEEISTLFDVNEEDFSYESISDNILNDFINHRMILRGDRRTHMDMWISYLAFIYDFNFNSGLRYIKEKNYITKIIDRIDYKNNDTKNKMEIIKNTAIDFIDNILAEK